LNKENTELYNYTQGGTLENLKYENGLEKSQIDQLMLKLKEKEIINSELEYELNEISETISNFNKKIKENEERNTDIEKEIKSLKK
jgi:peptidoglycan hydrolase CwlO-like protein